MTVINHNLFRDKFYHFTGKNFDLVSTIDHPYASPPIRLIDGHNSLKKIKDTNQLIPLICIWDVNSPDINRYRYDLSFDTGLMNNKDDNFFIFSDKLFYPLQKPKLINFIEVKKKNSISVRKFAELNKRKTKNKK